MLWSSSSKGLATLEAHEVLIDSRGIRTGHEIGLRWRNSPMCTLSQNGYGAKIMVLQAEGTSSTPPPPAEETHLQKHACRSTHRRFEKRSKLEEGRPLAKVHVIHLLGGCCLDLSSCTAAQRQPRQTHPYVQAYRMSQFIGA